MRLNISVECPHCGAYQYHDITIGRETSRHILYCDCDDSVYNKSRDMLMTTGCDKYFAITLTVGVINIKAVGVD